MSRLRVGRVAAHVLLMALVAVGCFPQQAEAPPQGGPTTTAASPLPPPPPRRVTLVASGDVLVHDSVAARARSNGGGNFDFRPMFDDVRPLITGADLAICHLETPLSRDNTGLSYYPIFNVPREVAQAVAHAGYDACTTASNHSMDKGFAGIVATLDILDAAAVLHTGTARTAAEAATPRIIEVSGVKIGLLSFTYGLNGIPTPPGRPWAANLIDSGRVLTAARATRAAGADFVVLALHWGSEYRTEPNAFQQQVAAQVLSTPDVDLILGHHAHVVQPIAQVGGRIVVYGMGNHISGQVGRCCPVGTEDGLMVHLTLEQTTDGFRVSRVRYTPTWVEAGTYRIVPVAGALANPATAGPGRQAMNASWCRTTRAVNLMGAHTFGVHPLTAPPALPSC